MAAAVGATGPARPALRLGAGSGEAYLCVATSATDTSKVGGQENLGRSRFDSLFDHGLPPTPPDPRPHFRWPWARTVGSSSSGTYATPPPPWPPGAPTRLKIPTDKINRLLLSAPFLSFSRLPPHPSSSGQRGSAGALPPSGPDSPPQRRGRWRRGTGRLG